MEAAPHHTIAQGVCECHQRHSLMVRHESAHHLNVLALRQPAARIVQRFVKTVSSQPTCSGESRKILHCGRRVNHCRESGGVRRDHQILAQPALESEPTYSETRVLICEVDITSIVG